MIAFIDLSAQQQRIRPQVEAALLRVLDHGQYIMGPEVFELEASLAQYCNVKHVITCANGTDALVLGLMALNVKPGDAIFVPSFTFAATAEVVTLVGATPVFVDVLPDTYNLDPLKLEKAIDLARKHGLKPTGIIPVDLFGQPADHMQIEKVAKQHGLWSMVDAAQSFGSTYRGRRAGGYGRLTTTSFFPAKPLGCYGEGGAIFTNDTELAETLRSLRIHGQGRDKYDNVRIGMNGRLETMQAAILLQKLDIFDDELERRQVIAKRYTEGLRDIVSTPVVIPRTTSSWAQYTISLGPSVDRNMLVQAMEAADIPTMIYYVKGLHEQPAYLSYPRGDMSVTESLSQQVLSLPMHPYLEEAVQMHIIETLRSAISSSKPMRMVG
ncbi:MAG: DegT/DnrJ/EryC1/StrS family aminotransferase [Alphaproteobacteria bacterium]